MIFDRAGGLHSLLVSIQTALALVLFGVVVTLFHARGILDVERYLIYGMVVVVALGYEFFKRDRSTVRTVLFEHSLLRLHPIALRQTITVLLALVLFVTLLKDLTLSRIFLTVYLVTLYPLLLFTSQRLPRWCAGQMFRGTREHKTLLIGSAEDVPKISGWLQNRKQLGFSTVGMLCDDDPREIVHGVLVFGGLDEIERVVRDEEIHQVIVLGLPVIMHRHSHVVTVCNRYGVRMAILSNLDTILRHPVVHIEDDGLQFLAMRQEPLENPRNRALKRLLDLGVAGAVTAFVLPPAALLVWLLHRWQSPGPLLHCQTRAGLQNHAFKIIKFRSMHCGNHDVARQATANDKRIFAAGRWLRKLSIDELPQFLNVLRGDMSVVGPRPHLVEHNREFAVVLEKYHIRAFVRPGVTGLAQVRGYRGEATPENLAGRLASDLLYLENWSLSVDISIILRTAWQVIRPPKTAV